MSRISTSDRPCTLEVILVPRGRHLFRKSWVSKQRFWLHFHQWQQKQTKHVTGDVLLVLLLVYSNAREGRHVIQTGVWWLETFSASALIYDVFPVEKKWPRRAQSVWRRATPWTAAVRFPRGARDFYLLHSVHNGSGAHPVSYPTN
jgi:hypothetical protein